MFAREFLFQDRFPKCCGSNVIRLDVMDAKRDFFGPDQITAIRLGAEAHANLTPTPPNFRVYIPPATSLLIGGIIFS
jgi:hypothetical protein